MHEQCYMIEYPPTFRPKLVLSCGTFIVRGASARELKLEKGPECKKCELGTQVHHKESGRFISASGECAVKGTILPTLDKDVLQFIFAEGHGITFKIIIGDQLKIIRIFGKPKEPDDDQGKSAPAPCRPRITIHQLFGRQKRKS